MSEISLIADILAAARKEPVAPPAAIEKTETDERQSLEIARLTEEIEEIRSSRSRNSDIHWARIIGLALLFILVVCWLVTICVFLYLSGRQYEGTTTKFLQLSDPVVIALIGSTTVNVIGLFYLAAKWLYPNTKEA
ncbi:MAG: hypothetical protein RLZZ522_531 [Verrucomicrobiota bacterium]|jgi:hypothetical protein